ncbi:MAG: hypothetical protein ACTS2F_26570 [Thainema sp.]
MMKPDLQGLELTPGEVRKLTGVGRGQVWQRSMLRQPDQRSQFLMRQLPEVLGLMLIGLFGFGIGFQGLSNLSQIELEGVNIWVWLIAIATSFSLAVVIRLIRILRSSSPALVRLLEDVERYNAVIRAIDINDQIEAAGNPDVALTDRNRVIATLWTTRSDLARALKTERILRENHRFIARNTDLFSHNLTSLSVLQVSDEVNAQGRILNEALEVAVSVQNEMRSLQQQDRLKQDP